MNRLFGKAKDKAPPPNLTDVIGGVSFIVYDNNIENIFTQNKRLFASKLYFIQFVAQN